MEWALYATEYSIVHTCQLKFDGIKLSNGFVIIILLWPQSATIFSQYACGQICR